MSAETIPEEFATLPIDPYMSASSEGPILNWHEGDVIRKLRASRGWTLEKLSFASGVNQQVIHKIEAGVTKEAKRRTLEKIARAFGLTARQILDAVPHAAGDQQRYAG